MRLDVFLTQHGYTASREIAKRRIQAGDVLVNGLVADKVSLQVEETDTVSLQGNDMPYVSRGGLKLEAALQAVSALPIVGGTFLDVGASTGGFTHCLLLHGAAHVVAVDVGKNQLHPSLRSDTRVTLMECRNAREMQPDWFVRHFDGAVMDVSFISVTKILPALRRILDEDAFFITLIKPQFEAGKAALDKHGVVRDFKIHKAVILRTAEALRQNGFFLHTLLPSPIFGQDGNREFLAVTIGHEGRVRPITDKDAQQCLQGEIIHF